MAHSLLQLRLVGCACLAFCIASTSACRNKQTSNRNEREEIKLTQDVTVNGRPQDVVFKDFENNWRKFVSENPVLAQPVVGVVQQREQQPEPIVTPECVYSDSAKGLVPRVTIIWNEPASIVVNQRTARAGENQQTKEAGGQEQTPQLRIDIGLHHDAFTRNFFSSALSTDVSKRFLLPSNSALLNNPEAVRLTGPGLFPQLAAFHSQALSEPATNQPIVRNTAVVQELSPGLSYQMRVSRPAGNQWTAEQQFVFMSPVCPNRF